MDNMPKVSIILPAYNEAEAIGEVVEAIQSVSPGNDDWEILVIDDGSTDETVDRATCPGVRVIRHPYNKGNGAAVKTGLRESRGEWVCLMDADGQHDPAQLSKLLTALETFDLVIGTRSGGGGGGVLRWLGNIFYNRLASYLANHPIPDLTSGFRAARRDRMLEFLPLFPNGFSYPVTSTMAFIKAGYNVGFVPIEVHKRVGRSKIRLLRDGIKFVLIALRIIMLFSPMRVFLPVSVLLFSGGAGYAFYTIPTVMHVTNTTVLLCTMSVVTFLIGLVAEQIALMRFERKQ
ncbi:MAG: glycosyltransferase family 2 protein [Acidobacteriota bacterium]